ncbi:MAG: Citrate transporter [Clostridia bacterium 62_21]|nr:MAG: Citrate transporter [Clostridia bacterium 62_21]HAG07770.1 citrate transporter [Peptococcaceae bacterium]
MTPDKLVKILVGPLLFLATLVIPFFGPVEARIGFGILFWMVYWWVTVAVDIKITCLVPLIVVAFYPFIPREDALKLYMHRDLYLIAGASMLTAAWVRWGLAKRVALNFLSLFGNNARLQTVGWFLLCGFVSFVMGNTPVGAIFAPIAVAALFYAGYKTFEQRYNSKAASNILIAVAWGASIGGMTTPLGGGQALVSWSFLCDYLGKEVFFLDWTLRMLPVSLLVMAAVAFFLYFFMKPDPHEERFEGGRQFYRQELQAMGPMTFEEKVCSYGFILIVLLTILRPFYADFVKGGAFQWLHPAHLFFIYAVLLFLIPSKKENGETILSVPTLVQHFPAAILFIWPGAVALGRVLDKTGAGEVFASWIQPLIDAGTIPAIVGVSAGSTFLSQFTTDTAAAGVVIPLVLKAFHSWNGLAQGSVPWVWIAGASLSWSFAIVSATGAQAIVAGFGANIKRMFTYGMMVATLCVLVTILYFVVTVGMLQLDFYIQPPGA